MIALFLGLTLLWTWAREVLVWVGGVLFLMALLAPLKRFSWRWPKKSALERSKALDWRIIDNSLARERPIRDCERQETLGICTGRECLVYDSCNFNIKKPLARP